MKRLLPLFLVMLCVIPLLGQHSIARVWNEATLYAVRNDLARPTIHARNLHHVTAAMYDAWAVFDPVASPYLLDNTVGNYWCFFQGFQTNEPLEEARKEAISHAAYTVLSARFRNSVGRDSILPKLRAVMDSLGYNWQDNGIFYTNGSPAALGNFIGRCYLSLGQQDNSNENRGFENRNYVPINPALDPEQPGNPDIIDLNHWQPLQLEVFVDQSGNPIPGGEQPFLSAEWGLVTPFSLTDSNLTVNNRDNFDYWVYHDPGTPPQFDSTGLDSNRLYQWGFEMVSVWSSHLDTADGIVIDISPATIGNNPSFPTSFEEYDEFYNFLEGGDASFGHTINPVTGLPYPANLVKRADYARVLAEFWADGPHSETPPGHWFVILNHVNDHPAQSFKFKGQGDTLDRLEWDIKSYFALGGAMHDAAISAWGIKGWYDYVRPISAIRALAQIGQRSDSLLPNYHPGGIALIPGYIEQIQPGDTLAGLNDEFVNDIKLYAWRGPSFIGDPDTSMAGVGWIRASEWWPYQRPTFVTPNFAGYVSGHSTFSRAAAEVLTAFTGDPYFPGGVGEFVAKKNEFLVFEEGPSEDIILQWATYRDASDQTSLSRIWGGIHPPADDIPGRIIGVKVGHSAFDLAEDYFFPDRDEDGFTALDDCDDEDPTVYPGAPEICDDKDNDCNGIINDGLQKYTYYLDRDRDGYGDKSITIDTCYDQPPMGFSTDSTDCNDFSNSINPGSPEICDRIDNNCNGMINEGLQRYRYYADVDRDGYGRSNLFMDTCVFLINPAFSLQGGDCDDTNPDIYPGAPEACDNIDSDCDGVLNNGLILFTYYMDSDLDGFGNVSVRMDTCMDTPPPGFVIDSLDCDDSNDQIYPGAPEICDNIDNNCNGLVNDGLQRYLYFFDNDGDGYGDVNLPIDTCASVPPQDYVRNHDDCDDNNPRINPSAPEVCDNIDNNCNGKVNDGLTRYMYYLDRDQDGYGDAATFIDTCYEQAPAGFADNPDDCNDNNDQIHPGAAEICDDIDNNCNGTVNDGLQRYVYFLDADGDGFGRLSSSIDTCADSAPPGFSENNSDCNDDDAMINPDAEEICDDIDNNCNGLVNDGLKRYIHFLDADGDGFGDATITFDTCDADPPTGYVTNSEDCNDDDSSIHPDAMESCDAIDNNCNGLTDEGLSKNTYFLDSDGDGFGDASMQADTCIDEPPSGYVDNDLDCDDTNASIYPGSVDIPDNGIDEDCNGVDYFAEPKLFPNPFMETITIHHEYKGSMTIIVHSINSNLYREFEVEFVNNSVTLDLRDLPSGVYIVRGYHPEKEEIFVHKIIRDIGR